MHFALKSELKQRPYSMLIILTCIITIILAFCIRTFEYTIVDPRLKPRVSIKDETNDLQSVQNSVWLIIVTMIKN